MVFQCRSRSVARHLSSLLMRSQLLPVLFTLILVAPACTPSPSSQKSRAEAEKSAEKARGEQEVARDAARKAMEDRMNEIEHRIAVLKEETKPARAEAKRKLDDAVAKLEAEAKEIRDKLSKK